MTHTAHLQTRPPRAAAFWDRIAKRYARRPVPDEAVYQEKLARTRAHLRPEMEVLELGCGTGSTALAHAAHVRRIVATDISGRMIEIARQKAVAAGIENVSFERAGVEEIAAGDETFDAVLALNLLHLVPDREAALDRIARVLRPGGVFVSSTACLSESMGWFRPIVAAGRLLGLLPLVRFFSAADFEESLRRHGFEIAESWRPGKGMALFVVARKAPVADPAEAAARPNFR